MHRESGLGGTALTLTISVNVAVRPRERTRPSTPEWASQNERRMMALRGQRGSAWVGAGRGLASHARGVEITTRKRGDEGARGRSDEVPWMGGGERG